MSKELFRTILSAEHLSMWPTFAVGIFGFAMFLICLWTFRPGSKKTYEKIRMIPLSNKTKTEDLESNLNG